MALFSKSPPKIWRQVADFISMMQFERGASPNTLASYERDLERFFSFFKKRKVESLTKDDIVGYVRGMSSLSIRTRLRHISCLRQFFRFLWREEIINADPTEDISTPSFSSIPRTIEENSMNKILNVADSKKDPAGLRTLCMVELLYSTGMRVSELVGLFHPIIFIEKNMMRVTGKGGKERLVCVNRNAMVTLRNYLKVRSHFDTTDSNKWLFPSRGSEAHITRHRVFQLIRDLAKEAGLDSISPHMIRHTMATHLLEGGADLVSIKDLLGHASVDTTQIYTHVDVKRKLEVVKDFHPLGRSK